MKRIFFALMAVAAIAMTGSFTGCKSKGEPKQESGIENGHEWIDLGLSVKWATCNVGATKPEEYGGYFAWGETSPKTTYDWDTYFDDNGFTKYNNRGGKTTLELEDDAAHVNWGGAWRMPTKAEQDELYDNCIWTWTTQNGVNGCLVKSKKNGNSIFLPASGYGRDSSCGGVGTDCDFWSSSLDEDNSIVAYVLIFRSNSVDFGSGYRYYGLSVRPVCE